MTGRAYFEALANVSHLDVLLPKASDLDVLEVLRNGSPDDLARAPARRNLFFDEQASVLLVLRTSERENKLREMIPSLELVLSAHATDAVPQGSGNAASASGKHDLDSKIIAAGSFAQLVSIADRTFVIWRPTLHLSRPRVRLQRPAIYITANLTLTYEATKSLNAVQLDYLPSLEPLPANVLEALQFDPALRDRDVSLPESRITKVAPRASRLQDQVRPIRGATRRAFPVVPALSTKIRYSALPGAIVASLHLETSQIIAGTVTINRVEVEVPNVQVDHLTGINLPLATQGGDETVMTYRLCRKSATQSTIDDERQALTVTICANALLDQGSTIDFELKWQTQVHMPTASVRPEYRWSRSPSVASAHQRASSTQTRSGVLFNEAVKKLIPSETGMHISISGPATVGKGPFNMRLRCSNRSSRTRRFAILMLQQRKLHASHDPVTHTGFIATILNATSIKAVEPLNVINLTPDVRVGPLPSGACFETHLRAMPTSTGVLDFGTGMRIIDLDTRQVVDVQELPEIVCLGPGNLTDPEIRLLGLQTERLDHRE
ncbi:hypothetical protein DOTSEDRAFT_68362 [Dothistroma septosporum NZE10]|uniref:Trafficking protein particle complex II-specific subunit 65 IgD3 domain-containing protein n=1 Tax=Dothistroma septosporum (strain NZE10 / CBS 128990) TaxID=675120 RepID=N1Q483_DOTSN|nr:hypothetical protein DOTSEDRAFT_68362 [Dothistroma septosporum NZE10]